MPDIFIVTQGEYSDYAISGVYSTFEKACAVAFKNVRKEDYYEEYTRVEIYPIDSENVSLKTYRVVRHVEPFGRPISWNCYETNVVEAPIGRVVKDYNGFSVYLQTDSEESALKIANDLISPVIAQEQGI